MNLPTNDIKPKRKTRIKMRLKGSSCLLLVIVMAACLQAQNLDIDLLKRINPQNSKAVFWGVTSSSAYVVPAGAVAGTLLYGIFNEDPNARRRAYKLGVSVVIASAVTQGIKYAVHRKRPGEQYPSEIFPANNTTGHSFPSGHTSLAFATATTLSLQYKKWYVTVPAYAWASAVGYSRMYRGLHYPSDVLAGAIVGAGGAVLGHWLTQKIITPKKRPS